MRYLKDFHHKNNIWSNHLVLVQCCQKKTKMWVSFCFDFEKIKSKYWWTVAERREGKPQDSGNGKDTTLEKKMLIYIFQTRFFAVGPQ